jgi:hypothetical protein
MTARRAVIYGSFGMLFVAYMAAANMPSQDSGPSAARVSRISHSPDPDALAADVRAQAQLLRERMAQAPVPAGNPRNPFAFGAIARATHIADHPVAATVVTDPAPPAPPQPALVLMGMAEDATPTGPRRTAIIGGENDALYMVKEGDTVAGRYTVTKIGADAVELEDLASHAYRRLALR